MNSNRQLIELRRRFNEVVKYRASDGKSLNEEERQESLAGWLCIGRVVYGAEWNKGKVSYVFADPNGQQVDLNDGYAADDFIEKHIALSDTNDGNGVKKRFFGNFDDRYDKVEVFDKYKNSYYDWLFNGFSEDKLNEEHDVFMAKLNRTDGNQVVLTHSSNAVIRDGYIKPGQAPNSYSTNKDRGVYFWCTKDAGRDPSNGAQYRYYCYVPESDIYDFQNNLKGYKHRDDALANERFVANYWPGSENKVIACNTLTPTLIDQIVDMRTGKRYDADWNELS